MTQLTQTAHELIADVLQPGDVAIDATAGNGHDTLFLAKCVGPHGVVYAFDVQAAALERTRERLQQASHQHVQLICGGHERLSTNIRRDHYGAVGAVMFNLGYLPGHSHKVRTQARTTLEALRQSVSLLRPGGVVTVVAYVGHQGGLDEANQVRAWLEELPKEEFAVDVQLIQDRQQAPQLYVARRLDGENTSEK